jgi:hypothetical protein
VANPWNDAGDQDVRPERRTSSNAGINRGDLWTESDVPAEQNELHVIDLLRRLETESDTGAAPAMERSKPQPTKWAQWDPEVTCSACQYLNPADQKFCGYCGTSLQTKAAPKAAKTVTRPEPAPAPERTYFEEFQAREAAVRTPDAAPQVAPELAFQSEIETETRFAAERKFEPEPRFQAETKFEPGPAFDFEESLPEIRAVEESPNFGQYTPATQQRDDSDLEFLRYKALGSSEPSSRWRIPVAVAVLAILGFVGYRKYNGLGLLPEQVASALHPAQSATPSSAIVSDQAPVADDSSSTLQEPAKSLPQTPAPKAAPVAKSKAPASLRGEDRGAVTPATQRSRENLTPPAALGVVGGREELAQAQHYLAPATRDSAEAAKWLWKAVGKENPKAVLLLSDLYVSGDGVAKSCDQARLLLTVAAKKGNADAASRLSGLESCQ